MFLKKQESSLTAFKTQAIALTLATLLIVAKNDSRFPSMSDIIYQLLLAPFTALLITTLMFSINSSCLRVMPHFCKTVIEKIGLSKLTSFIAIVFEICALSLMLLSNIAGTRYHTLNVTLTFAFFALAIGGFIITLLKKKTSSNWIFILTLAAYLGSYLISIGYFPLLPGRSDMLYLINEAGKRFLAGFNPYTQYLVPYPHPYFVPLTYLPGMWLSYLPAALLGIDPRFINMLAIMATAGLLYFLSDISVREKAALLIVIFLLNPYLQFRHDIYLGVYWLPLCLGLLLLQKQKIKWSALVFSWSLAVSQFSWILYPFYLLFLKKSYGLRIVIQAVIIAFLVAVLVVAPFVLWSFDDFYEGVFKHWNYLKSVESFNISYWIATAFSWNALRIFQALVLFVPLVLYLRKPSQTLKTALYWMAIATILFLLFNSLIWTYLYLTVFLLITTYILLPERAW
jgi:hypothetical protein